MTAVGLAQHLGILWVAIELTTLATAPLIYFNRNARSLEAAWKYLLVSSLGIALALLGTFFVALSGAGPGGPRSLLLGALVEAGPELSRPWIRAAFVFLLVGYGTKMGLAPLHSWKPDAYGEAPGILGALLAGGVTNVAFLSLFRVFQVARAAGEQAFARDALARPRPPLHGARRGLHGRAAGLQAHARLLQRRAHGHPRRRPRPRRLRGRGRLLPPAQQRPREGRPLPHRRQHPPLLRVQARRRRAGRGPPPALVRGRCSSPASWP